MVSLAASCGAYSSRNTAVNKDLAKSTQKRPKMTLRSMILCYGDPLSSLAHVLLSFLYALRLIVVFRERATFSDKDTRA
jgi:hypothetical protein